jgi:hypothetical protein
MFNPFHKKDTTTQTDAPAISPEQSSVSQFLIITAATNFGLVVLPDTKKPLMLKMEPGDTIAACVARSAPYVSAAVDVSTCLVIQLSAELPNHTHAANKIYALILPDPGVLINQDLVLIGYEEIEKMPSATASMLQMLVKQMPKEYFAEPTVDPLQKNSSSTAPIVAAPAPEPITTVPALAVTPAVEPVVEVAMPAPAPLVSVDTMQVVAEPPTPENPVQTA